MRGSGGDAHPRRPRRDDAADPVRMRGEPVVDDRVELRRPVRGSTGIPLARIDVGTFASGSDGPDDRLGLGHDLFGRAVVDAQRGERDLSEPDPLESLPATSP